MKPSVYQERIIDFVKSGRGNGAVNAVAGSGKTTSLVMAAEHIEAADALFLAFNKAIATEMQTRLGNGVEARTNHSLGYKVLARELGGRLDVKGNKYWKLAQAWTEGNVHPDDAWTVNAEIKRVAEMARLTLTPLDGPSLERMAVMYDLDVDFPEHTYRAIPKVIDDGMTLAQNARQIDFADMIYIPVAKGWKPDPHSWLLIDEAQDLNAAQRTFVLSALGSGGRVLTVGDPLQAIYGFAGADYAAWTNLVGELSAQELPLSICYRCPAEVLALARQIVPHIETWDQHAPGVVREGVDPEKLPEIVQEGDLILCRTNAPLFSAAFRMIARQIPARIKGRDLGQNLVSLIKKALKFYPAAGIDIEAFPKVLDYYVDKKILALLQREDQDNRIESLRDRSECLHICFSEMAPQSFDDFYARIDGLFSDERASVWLSTIHRAKGTENERVYILEPDLLPLFGAEKSPAAYQQELNLCYVAVTRAKHELIFLGNTPHVLRADQPTKRNLATPEEEAVIVL